MKKIILSIVFFSLLFTFVPTVKAQATEPTQTQLTQQLIVLITQLIAQLQQQLDAILAQQIITNSSLQKIQSPSINSSPAISGNFIPQQPVDTHPPTVTCDKSTNTYQTLATCPNLQIAMGGCQNCVAVMTNEPTTLKLFYGDYIQIGTAEGYAQAPINIKGFDDNSFSTQHIIYYQDIGFPHDQTPLYRYEVTNTAGNTYKTIYDGGLLWGGARMQWSNNE